MANKELTKVDFWDNSWEKTRCVNYRNVEIYFALNKKFDSLFKKYIHTGNKKLLELGCAKGKKLIYFAKNFKYRVYGIDYSKKGIEMAKRNLQDAKIDGNLIYANISNINFKENAFDVVCSFGLVEHFEESSNIIDLHINFLKNGGYLIITIPNYRDSLYFYIFSILNMENIILKSHNLDIMDKEVLLKILESKPLEIIFFDYFGPINMGMIIDVIENKSLKIFLHILSQLIGYITFFMPSSRFFSPYIVLIAKKSI